MKKDNEDYAKLIIEMRNKIGMLLESTAYFHNYEDKEKFNFFYSCFLTVLSEFFVRAVKKESWEELLNNHIKSLKDAMYSSEKYILDNEEVKH